MKKAARDFGPRPAFYYPRQCDGYAQVIFRRVPGESASDEVVLTFLPRIEVAATLASRYNIHGLPKWLAPAAGLG